MEHQIHFNKKFYIDKKTGYWICTQKKKIRAHVWVWINYHGKIPKGFHIHHKDGNKSNNVIENLDLLNPSEHAKHHSTQERRDWSRKWIDKIRPLTKKWHGSEEGLAWHKAQGILGWINKKPIKITCKFCNKEAETKSYHQEFCSNKCKSAWRRQSGLDDISRKCPICEIDFTINKYTKTKMCSKKCGALFRQNHKEKL